MTLFQIAPVDEQPEENMIWWSVREVLMGTDTEKSHHLVGYILWQHAGRVTSKIITFDKDRMLVKTESGRVYYLEGPPGSHSDSEYVWKRWSRINQAQDEIDVTHQYWITH